MAQRQRSVSDLRLPLPSLPRQLELSQMCRHATRRSLAYHRARVSPGARRLPLAARLILLSCNTARVVEKLGALGARNTARFAQRLAQRLAQRRAGARAPPRRDREAAPPCRIARDLSRERRDEVNEDATCARTHAPRRSEFDLKLPCRVVCKLEGFDDVRQRRRVARELTQRACPVKDGW